MQNAARFAETATSCFELRIQTRRRNKPMPWSPDEYEKFKRERFAPFDDLIGYIEVRPGMSVIDLGCGTGELTNRLAKLLPESDVLGIDSSEEMLSRAKTLTRAGLRFENSSIESAAAEWDLVFSHAAIQWVDDHTRLIPRLLNLVRPGGQLAIQLPSNHDHPSHQIITQISSEEPFVQILKGWTRHSPVLSISQYADLLYNHGCEAPIVLEKVYPHVLSDSDALVDWTSSTALVPYFEKLGEARELFLTEYRKRLRTIWPIGPLFYGFRRTLLYGKPTKTSEDRRQ